MKNKTKKNSILLFIVTALFVIVPVQQTGSFSNFNFGESLVFAQELTEEEKDEIEEEEGDIKDDIKDLEKKKKEEQKKLKRYEGDVDRLEGVVYSAQRDINKTESKIESVKETIERKEQDINNLNENVEFKKIALKRMIQKVYFNSEQPITYLLLEKNSFFETLTSTDNVLNLKEEILVKLDEINQSKSKIEEEKIALGKKKEEHEDLLWVKESQKSSLVSEKRGFEQKVEKKKLSVSQINAKISKLKSTLSSFLGESFDASDIVDAVKFASKKTGVRKEFLMAMLDKETDLGRFTGGCTYKNTRVRDYDKDVFKDICEELDYNYKKKKISCSLSYGYGGAMGVAQFMPTTWIGYKNRISSYTGHNPPDPWDLTDGVVGMAIKLGDAGGDKKSGEYKAAAIYYCGGNWDRTVCHNYASTVKNWSSGYDDYF